ncbi:MAG: ABC transporter permease [Bacteroidota bacterium]
MIKNYLKVALRNIARSKLHSFINIFGLALGIACCILIALFVKEEWSFDKFHGKADQIHRVWVFEDYGENEQFFNTVTPYPTGQTLKNNFQEVSTFVQFNHTQQVVEVADQSFSETVTLVSPSFFHVFDFDVLRGRISKVFEGQNNVVITESIKTKYFGKRDAVGEIISMNIGDGMRDFEIKAIMADPPTNSSLQFSILISTLNNKVITNERVLNSWFNVSPETYVLLEEGVDRKAVEAKFPEMVKQIMGEQYVEDQYNIGLQPLTEIHLDTSFPVGYAQVSDPQYAFILSAVAVLILIVASINFVTLAISRSLGRAKEVGVRKVVGARKKQLVEQFLSETIVITLIALMIGVIMSFIGLPVFNQFANRSLVLQPDAFIILTSLLIVVLIGIVSGSYPAIILSGFKPVKVLKGQNKQGGKKQPLRKVLVGVQFVLSIFLISSTLVMEEQLKFLQNKHLGFDKEQLIMLQLNVPNEGGMTERIQNGMEKADQFKNELASFGAVKSVTASTHSIGTSGWTNVGYTDQQDIYRTFNLNIVAPSYVDVMGMKLEQGRNFDINSTSDLNKAILVNQSLVKTYGWDDPIGQRLPGDRFGEHVIIGVVADFNYASLHGLVEPLAITINPRPILQGIENIGVVENPIPKVFARAQADQIPQALAAVESVWKKLMPGEEFEYSFIDQRLNTQYQQEQNLGKVITIASMLAILIGSMGLFGLASLTLQNRAKEVSIRKVLGATEKAILVLLSREYVIMVVIALALAIPITWYFMSQWLSSFAYRINIGWGAFALAGVLALFIALATVAYQVIKTALTKPVERLKYE